MKQLSVGRTRLDGVLYGRTGRRLVVRDLFFTYTTFDLTTFERVGSFSHHEPTGRSIHFAFWLHGRATLEHLGAWPAGEELPPPGEANPVLAPLLADYAHPLAGLHPSGRSYFRADPDGDTSRVWQHGFDGGRLLVAVRHVYDVKGRIDASACGRHVALAEVSRRAWLTTPGPELTTRELPHTDDVFRVRFAPDGAALATAAGRTVYLWEVPSGKPRWRSKAFRRAVEALAFTPDGRLLLAGSSDGRVRAWDVASGRERLDLDWGLGAVHALAVAPDGATAAAACQDGSAIVWDLDA